MVFCEVLCPRGFRWRFGGAQVAGPEGTPRLEFKAFFIVGMNEGVFPLRKGRTRRPPLSRAIRKEAFLCVGVVAALLLSFRQTDPVPAEVNLEMTIGRSQVCPAAFPLLNGMEFVYLIFGKRGMPCTKDEEGASDSRPAGSREVVRTIVVGSIVG